MTVALWQAARTEFLNIDEIAGVAGNLLFMVHQTSLLDPLSLTTV
jgi:hypothetical protein